MKNENSGRPTKEQEAEIEALAELAGKTRSIQVTYQKFWTGPAPSVASYIGR